MAFTSSDIAAGYGAAITQEPAVSVSGIEPTLRALWEWQEMAVYVTTFTSGQVAKGVFFESQRHVPYDTGELYDSGFVEQVERIQGSAEHSTIFGKQSPVIDESFPGVGDLNKYFPDMSSLITVPTFGKTGPMRGYTRWMVGYDAPHAVLVHENLRNIAEWGQGKGPYPSEQKWDHFLLKAYEKHQDVFSAAMKAGIEASINAIGVKAAAMAKSAPAPGLAAGVGKPRLIKR